MILLIEARAIVRVKGGHVPGRASSDKPGLCGNIRTWMPRAKRRLSSHRYSSRQVEAHEAELTS